MLQSRVDQLIETHTRRFLEHIRPQEETQRLLTPEAIDHLAEAIHEDYNHNNPAASQPFNITCAAI